jgi:cell division protein FtsL
MTASSFAPKTDAMMLLLLSLVATASAAPITTHFHQQMTIRNLKAFSFKDCGKINLSTRFIMLVDVSVSCFDSSLLCTHPCQLDD